MEKIYVYADFDFLSQTEEIGTLSYERVRGNDHFAPSAPEISADGERTGGV